MDKDCRYMTCAELQSYAVKHKLSPIGTGRNGLVIKADLIKVCEAHQNTARAAQQAQNIANAACLSYIHTIPGQISVYDLEAAVLCRRLNTLVASIVDARTKGEMIPVESAKYVLRECMHFQKKGVTDFDHIIPTLRQLSVEEDIL